jgi:hypothetical protein
MVRKSGHRFSEKIMLKLEGMIRKVGHFFSGEIVLKPLEPQGTP